MSESAPVEAPPDWIELRGYSLSIEVSIMGHRERASICGRCGSIVFDLHKSLHEEFHARLVEDPRYPYGTVAFRKGDGAVIDITRPEAP